jgi:hypothetical protein
MLAGACATGITLRAPPSIKPSESTFLSLVSLLNTGGRL